jgi:hypothetical protein
VSDAPRIRPLDFDVGSHPQARLLNAQFSETIPLLRLRLEVGWTPRDAGEALFRLERQLARLSPSLAHHQCRGPHDYRVLRTQERGEGGPPRVPEGYELPLALAHLLEHLIIDAVAYLTEAPVISGATAALREPSDQYDIFVECPDPALAPLVVALPLSWVTSLAAGQRLDGEGWTVLVVARYLYLRPGGAPCDPGAVARRLLLPTEEVAAALCWLKRNGFARSEGFTVNFSGLDYCRLDPSGGGLAWGGEAVIGPWPRARPGDGAPPRARETPGGPPSTP